MKHLTDAELSAYLDGAVRGREAEGASRHLAACQPCREALAEMAAQDQSLRPVLSHDPGDDYFESFAARVDDRIRAAGLAGAPTHGDEFDLWRLFRSPRALAWSGAVGVIVVGGGLALMTWREGTPPGLRGRETMRFLGSAPAPNPPSAPAAPPSSAPPASPAGSPSGSPSGSPTGSNVAAGPAGQEEMVSGSEASGARALARDQGAAAPAKDESKAQATARADERAAAPTRAMEMTRTESGEEVPVKKKDMPAMAPAPSAPVNVAGESQIRKKTQASPMSKQAAPAASLDAYSQRPEAAQSPSFAAPAPSSAAPVQSSVAGEVRVCGDVRDPQGRPIAGAQVVASDLGRTARADTQGRFCMSLPPGEHPVSVMAVGYAAIRRTLRTGEGEARLTLAVVPVLEGDGVAAPKMPSTVSNATTNRVTPFAVLPDSLLGPVREAERLEAEASAHRSASQYDAAAGAWERSLKGLAGGPLDVEARRRLANARYRAWELSPTADRARSAADALNGYVARAPAGPDRARAVQWLDQVRP